MGSQMILSAVLLALATGPSTGLAQHAHGESNKDSAPALSAPEWTKQPLLLPSAQRGAGGPERGAAQIQPIGISAREIHVTAADGPADRRQLAYPVGAQGARIEPAAPQAGNYHWLSARQEMGNEVRVASSVWYFSNPGKAPTELLLQNRNELEIIPQPLPREHSNYRESEKWRFLVRWLGKPLPGQAVTLETEAGSRSRFTTDANGIATVLFPRDLRPAPQDEAGGHQRRLAKFVLSTEKPGDGNSPVGHYVTAFNYVYAADADRERSLSWGAVFGLIGMFAATPLLRRRQATTEVEKVDA